MTVRSLMDFGDKPKTLAFAPVYGEKLETLPLGRLVLLFRSTEQLN